MTLVEARPVLLSSSGLVKMEDRKRPASYENDDSAPPHKRQITSALNGSSKAHQDVDLPGKEELEKFQKEAVFRQMNEYKREKTTLEARLNDITNRAASHDDHLRSVDAWFGQLLDEVKILTGKLDTTPFTSFPSSLLSADNKAFEQYLKSRSNLISSAISSLFDQPSKSEPEVAILQTRIAELLSREKMHINELEKSRLEKEQMEERLETASMRYMMAEKKLDRAKSLTVAKLDRQSIAGGRGDSGGGPGDGNGSGNDVSNGQVDNSEALAEAETARKEAVVASAVQKEQLEKLTMENEKLFSQVTSLNNKLSHLGDDDYARTDLFKHLKSQHEDVIKRINDLEATNIELREEATKLQAERTAYRIQLDTESQAVMSEKELQLTKVENDLARIRTTRDELLADVNVRKAAQDVSRDSIDQIRNLAAANEDRIKVLESEVNRLRGAVDNGVFPYSSDSEPVSTEQLQAKYTDIKIKYSMLDQELKSMGTAYKKTSSSASQKINQVSDLEEKIMRLTAEKSKADQKYFGAMKTNEVLSAEVRLLRTSNAKSSEIISQIKDADASARALVVTQEKQLAEAKDAFINVTKQHRQCQQQVIEKMILMEDLKEHAKKLEKSVTEKHEETMTLRRSTRKAEVEVEELKVRLQETQKSLESWTSKKIGNRNDELEMLRSIAICTVCRKNFKDTALKTCGHVFCKECVDERIASRSRKCPGCNKAFGSGDHMHITY